MTFHQVIFPASQMKLWVLKAVVLSLFCSVCLSAKSNQVHFNSTNFINTLKWDPVEPVVPGENITYKYSVEYKQYADGKKYEKKAGCQNITVLFCDLTEETQAIRDGHYWARVFVNGELHGTTKKRFTPLADTILGPPTISTKPTVSGLHIDAILPLGPKGESLVDIIARSSSGINDTPPVIYTLEMTDPKMAPQDNTVGQFNLKLKSNTLYCGHVFYRPSSAWGRLKSEEAFFCAKVPADPLDLLPWLIISAVCLLALLIMSFLCACKYMKVGKVSKPSILMISKTSTKVLLPQNETISIPELNVHLQNVKINSIQLKPSVPSPHPGCYSPQEIPWQIRQDSSAPTADPSQSSAQSSVSYGAVAVQDHEDQGPFKDPEISTFPGVECVSDHEMTSMMAVHTGPPSSLPDCHESDPSQPLLLHTVRDSDGNLVLPFCSFQFQSSTANLQRRPLLSDLKQSSLSSLENLDNTESSECDDSMPTTPTQTCCNSDYSPKHVVIPNLHQGNLNSSSTDGRSESCYKQNQIPEVIVETVSMHSDRRTDYTRTWNGLIKEESDTEEDREGLESLQLCGHFLGNWALQIQD